ncbi:MAG: hypothetical protein CMJ18_11980 [Phycisphaeraceae bacterium]|nr:hypothetical protein [Phycisphaeraceae bacterium]
MGLVIVVRCVQGSGFGVQTNRIRFGACSYDHRDGRTADDRVIRVAHDQLQIRAPHRKVRQRQCDDKWRTIDPFGIRKATGMTTFMGIKYAKEDAGWRTLEWSDV